MIIDSHCHLDYEPLFKDLKGVLDRALKNNIRYFLTISTTDKNFNKIEEILKTFDPVYGTYGIHPHETKFHTNIDHKYILAKINSNKKIIGVGETGLDFYYNHSNKNIQKKLFLEHIKAAQISGLPIIVHTRNAEKETFNILNTEFNKKKFKILLHCFTGTKEFAQKMLKLESFISASGIVTFKKSKELSDIFKDLPLDKIIVETDSPYLSPDPLRGKTNEPSHIIHTVKHLARIKGINEEEFSKVTSSNFFNLFGKLN
tara:strand:+ start:5827 stop:6603 length:777 start_codon:yes stop_codon:yes gene_type:complete